MFEQTSLSARSRTTTGHTVSPIHLACLMSSVSRRNGGIFEAERRMVQTLASEQSVGVDVLGLEDEHTRDDVESWHPVVPRTFAVTGPKAFGQSLGLRAACDTLEADLLNVAGLWMYPSVVAARWGEQMRRPYVVTPHGMLDPWALRRSRWKKRIAEWLYERHHLRHAACLRALCEAEVMSIRQYGLANPICVVPNGVDLPEEERPDVRGQRSEIRTGDAGDSRFSILDPRSTSVSTHHSPLTTHHSPPWADQVPAGKKVMLFLGRIHPKKGLMNLINAWAGLHDAGCRNWDEWSLVIAGWDQEDHERELRQRASDGLIDDRVHFIGPLFHGAKASAYRYASAFVLPSLSEGLPMTVLEAWSHRRPVLMTQACNLPEGFSHDAAWPIPTDVPSLCRQLDMFLFLTDAQRQAMGDRGFRLVAERFTWSRVAAQMRQVYDWLLGGGPRPECVLM